VHVIINDSGCTLALTIWSTWQVHLVTVYYLLNWHSKCCPSNLQPASVGQKNK